VEVAEDFEPPESSVESVGTGRKEDRHSTQDRLGRVVFAVGALTAGIWLMVLGRGLNFFFDEWDWVDSSRISFWTSDFAPHNGHPVVVPFAIYRLVMVLAGIRHYWPFLLLVVLANLLCGWLLFVLLRRRIHPVIAASAVSVLMLLGPAWQDLLWPFQIGFLGSVAGGLGALILLDRRRPTADVAALVCLLLSVFSSAIGLTMVAGITVELLWLRRDRKRIWIPLASAAAFTLWDLTKARGSSTLVAPAASAGARYVGQSAAGAVGALVGRDTAVGSILAITLAALVVAAVIYRPRESGRLAMAVVGGLTFWLLTLVTRGSDPTASRYLYPGVVFVLMAVGELPHLLAGGREHRAVHSRDSPLVTVITGIVLPVVVVAYAVVAIAWNSAVLHSGQRGLAGVAQTTRAELAAVQLESRALAPMFQPDTTYMPQVKTGPYLKTIAAFGSPAATPTSLAGQPPDVRGEVDAMLLRGLPMRMVWVPAGQAETGACRSRVNGQTVIVSLSPSGVWITAPPQSDVQIAVRSYGTAFIPLHQELVVAGQTDHLRWPGTTQVTWSVALQSAPLPTIGCAP
jgi:hypothetical protein